MTIEERFERIEHITAGLAEEHRRDHEENRQLWRDTQRQINELAVRMSDLTVKVADTNGAITRLAEETHERIDRLAEESRAADRQLGERIDALAEETRDADRKLGERIEALVSAIGQFLARQQ